MCKFHSLLFSEAKRVKTEAENLKKTRKSTRKYTILTKLLGEHFYLKSTQSLQDKNTQEHILLIFHGYLAINAKLR